MRSSFSGSSSKPTQTTRLSSADLINLAKAIEGQASSSSLPPVGIHDTIRLFKYVISERQECSASLKGDGNHKADEDHDAFVKVLEQVVRSLEAAILKSKQLKDIQSKRKESTGATLSNKFDLLTVEDPSEILGDQSTKASAPVKMSQPKPAVVFELESNDDGGKFALWCPFQECQELRASVKAVWQGFWKKEEVTLLVASLVAESGCDLIQQIVRRFANDFPGLDTYDRVEERLKSFGHSKNQNEMEDQGKDSDKFCTEAWSTLSAVKKALRLHSSREAMKALQGSHELGPVVYDCLHGLQKLRKNKGLASDLCHLDTYTLATMDFVQGPTRLTKLEYVLMTQMVMEIMQVCQDRPRVPWEITLQDHLMSTYTSLTKFV
jgi:hypothetical protein